MKSQSHNLGVVLILATIVLCFVTMGQDRSKVGMLGDNTGHDWIAIPHESDKLIYYVRTDQILGIIEVIDDETAASGAFGRCEIILNSFRIRTDMTFDEVTESRELSRDDPSEAREAYLSSEKEKDDE